MNYMKDEGFTASDTTTRMSVDMNYAGQAFQVEIPIREEWLSRDGMSEIETRFHQDHHRIYSHSDKDAPTQIMNLRISVIGDLPKPQFKELQGAKGEARPVASRKLHYDRKSREASVYRYNDLLYGNTLAGPAIVEHDDTTTTILDGFTGKVDQFGNIIIIREGGC